MKWNLQKQQQIQFRAGGCDYRHVLRKLHKPPKNGNVKSEKEHAYGKMLMIV